MDDQQPIESTPRPDRKGFPYPWLKHGVRIEDAEARVSVALAAKLAGLDDVVVKVPQVAAPGKADPQVGNLANPEKWMTVSTRPTDKKNEDGTPILACSYHGTVGSRYQVVQNVEAFDFFNVALGEGAACVEGAGRMGPYGASVFLIAAMPQMLEIVPGDPVERHLLLTNSHDGSGNIEVVFINWRVLSNTGVQYTTESQGRVRIRHTKNAKAHVHDAHKILAKNEEYWKRATNIYRYMAKRDVSAQRAKAFVEAMYPDIVERDDEGKVVDTRTSHQALHAREQLMTMFEDGCPGGAVAGKTDWGLYNCVAYFVEHDRTNRSKKAGAWEVSTFGAGAQLRSRAYNWLSKDQTGT